MAIVFTVSLQLGTGTPLVFETDLTELTLRLKRPLPEIKGAKIHPDSDRLMSWLVVCTLRGPLMPPEEEELTVEVVERTWTDGIVRVMQEATARLAYHHRADLEGSRYEFYGRRDDLGHPRDTPQHYQYWHHLQHMEYLLHHTHTYLDCARMGSISRTWRLFTFASS